jgi:hypothetical protein
MSVVPQHIVTSRGDPTRVPSYNDWVGPLYKFVESLTRCQQRVANTVSNVKAIDLELHDLFNYDIDSFSD